MELVNIEKYQEKTQQSLINYLLRLVTFSVEISEMTEILKIID